MTAALSRNALGVNRPRAGTIVLGLGFAALAVPTVVSLAQESWSREIGAHGPIVLVTGLWLFSRQLPDIRLHGRPGQLWITLALAPLCLASYVLGRAFDFLSLETAGLLGLAVTALQSAYGAKVLLKHWFPLLYLAFVIPPPGSILADLTAPLKQLVSIAATDCLQAFGLPVARQGVTIFIAQYQLLVEDACSGMNSIVGLIAVSLLYIYLVRGSSWLYSLVLVMFVVPIAIMANIVRIMILIILTYFAGNDVAQGYLHFTAGMVLFASALACVFALDRLLSYVLSKRRRPA